MRTCEDQSAQDDAAGPGVGCLAIVREASPTQSSNDDLRRHVVNGALEGVRRRVVDRVLQPTDMMVDSGILIGA